MDVVEELQNSLKDKMAQWFINSESTSVSFEGELKDISFNTLLGNLLIKVKGPRKGKYAKNPQIMIHEPITFKKEDDEIKLRYTIFSKGNPVLVTGFLKREA